MPAPSRFTFDLDLAPSAGARSLEPGKQAEAREAGRAEGYAQGYAEGERSATAASERALAAAAEDLAARAASLLAGIDEARTDALEGASSLAHTIAGKLAGHLLAHEPAGEIEALIAECLGSLDGVPHLVVRCHPDLAGRLKESTEARMAESGFAGRLIVIGDAELGPTDGRIEWAEGGLVRDMQAISREIETRIAEFFAGRRARQENGVSR